MPATLLEDPPDVEIVPTELFPVLGMTQPADQPQMCRCVITPDELTSDDAAAWRYQRMELTMPILAQTTPDRLRQFKKETLVRRVRRLERDLHVSDKLAKKKDGRNEELTVRIEDLKRLGADQLNETNAEIEGLCERLHKERRDLEDQRDEWRHLAQRESEERMKIDHALQMSLSRRPNPDAVNTVAKSPDDFVSEYLPTDEEMGVRKETAHVVLTRPKQDGPIRVEVRKPNRLVETYEAKSVTLEGLHGGLVPFTGEMIIK